MERTNDRSMSDALDPLWGGGMGGLLNGTREALFGKGEVVAAAAAMDIEARSIFKQSTMMERFMIQNDSRST